jgi:hypothetical protein
MAKWSFWGMCIVGAGVGFLAFLFSDSYQKSLEAKWYYAIGSYSKAHTLATEAYTIDPYNKMAFGILKQSELSMRFLQYIEDSDSYLQQIQKIVAQDSIQSDDRIRVKMMCEIMIGEFKRFRETVLTDDTLVARAKANYEQFRIIYESVY